MFNRTQKPSKDFRFKNLMLKPVYTNKEVSELLMQAHEFLSSPELDEETLDFILKQGGALGLGELNVYAEIHPTVVEKMLKEGTKHYGLTSRSDINPKIIHNYVTMNTFQPEVTLKLLTNLKLPLNVRLEVYKQNISHNEIVTHALQDEELPSEMISQFYLKHENLTRKNFFQIADHDNTSEKILRKALKNHYFLEHAILDRMDLSDNFLFDLAKNPKISVARRVGQKPHINQQIIDALLSRKNRYISLELLRVQLTQPVPTEFYDYVWLNVSDYERIYFLGGEGKQFMPAYLKIESIVKYAAPYREIFLEEDKDSVFREALLAYAVKFAEIPLNDIINIPNEWIIELIKPVVKERLKNE